MTEHLLSPTQTTNGETMNTIPNSLPTLSAGSHKPDEGKACVMEYVSLLAGEAWSDSPSCTYPPLAWSAQIVNDRLSDGDRHLLVPLIGRLFGTTLPVDGRVFALRVARTVEHLNPVAEACNDVTERFIAGEATSEELSEARRHADTSAATDGYVVTSCASYAAAAASYAASAATDGYVVTSGAAAYAAAAATATDPVAWLSSIIDIYDEVSGRTEHRQVSDSELAELALAVQS